jgi:YggT family protein
MLGIVIVINALGKILEWYLYVLICRLILDWIQMLARQWRPSGPVLFLAEAIYTVTDPPLKFVRRLIPPLSLGGIRLDLAFLVLMLAVSLSSGLLQRV